MADWKRKRWKNRGWVTLATRPDPSKLGGRHIDNDAFTRKKTEIFFRKRKEMFSPLLNHLCQAMRRTKEIMPFVADESGNFYFFNCLCGAKTSIFWGVMSSQIACMLRFSFISIYPYKKVECTTWKVQCDVIFSDLSKVLLKLPC